MVKVFYIFTTYSIYLKTNFSVVRYATHGHWYQLLEKMGHFERVKRGGYFTRINLFKIKKDEAKITCYFKSFVYFHQLYQYSLA
jgi:hypothetical protein